MILHCTRKLAERLSDVSTARLTETDQLGSWQAHLYSIDRRQCLFFCHDATRYCLLLPGVRAPQLKELGRWHRDLFLAALVSAGAEITALKRIELALGATRFDTATDRSVLSSMTVARWDLEGSLARIANVLDLDPVAVSRHLNKRPAMAGRVLHWPEREMLERVAAL
jgi:uncharacterized protein DUF6933